MCEATPGPQRAKNSPGLRLGTVALPRPAPAACGPYGLVLPRLLAQGLPPLLGLHADLLALQLLHGGLVLLRIPAAEIQASRSGHPRAAGPDRPMGSQASQARRARRRCPGAPRLPAPRLRAARSAALTLSLECCSSCSVCSCICAKLSASLACPAGEHAR